jgi:hypothetical protein
MDPSSSYQPVESNPTSSYQAAESDPSSSYQPAVIDPASSSYEPARKNLPTSFEPARMDQSSSYRPAGTNLPTTYQPAKMDPSSSLDEQDDVISLFANPNYCYANDIPASGFTTSIEASSAMNMPTFSYFSGMTGLMTQSNQNFLPNNLSSGNEIRVNQQLVGNHGYKPSGNFSLIGDQGMPNSIGAPMNNFRSYQ